MEFDEAFIAKLRKGNRKGFEKLFLNTYESLCEYSASITRSKEDAEGAVQDVFAALWQNRMDIASDTNIRAYLFKSVKNRSIDIIQHKGLQQKFQEHITAMYQKSVHDETISTVHLIKRVREEVDNLPEKSKTVYLLHRRDGLTYSEISQVLGITVKAVESRMTKALRILREKLQTEKDLNLLPLLAIFLAG